MQRLVRSLNETIQYIDAVIDTRIERRNNTGLVGVTWREDANLKAIMTDLKSQAQVISHSAVKFALLANTSSPSDPNLSRNVTSICDEIGPQIGTFYNIFLRMSECSVAECLFDEAAHCVRNMLGIFQELLKHIQEHNRDAINYMAGEMTKVLSDVAEGLPLANKAAYRRYLARKCKGLKEIIDEFSTYIEEAKTNAAAKSAEENTDTDNVNHVFEKLSLSTNINSSSASAAASAVATVEDVDDDKDEDEEDEDDMEERDYLPSELPLVEKAVSVLQRVLDTIKLATVTMTNIADTLLSTNATAEDNSGNSELIRQNNVWIVQLLATIDRLESICIDLGAALYPPVLIENEDLVTSYGATVFSLQEFVDRDIASQILGEEGLYKAYCEEKLQGEVRKLRETIMSLPLTL